jgi:hypothetical protein
MQRIAGAFLVGIVAGAAITLAVKGHDVELLYLQMAKVRAENNQLQDEIDILNKDILDKQRQIERKVRKIEVTAKAPDEFTKLAITKYVKDRLRTLAEMELSYFETHPQVVFGLIDGRTFTFERQPYLLRVESVVIGETLHIWVEGIKQTPTP